MAKKSFVLGEHFGDVGASSPEEGVVAVTTEIASQMVRGCTNAFQLVTVLSGEETEEGGGVLKDHVQVVNVDTNVFVAFTGVVEPKIRIVKAGRKPGVTKRARWVGTSWRPWLELLSCWASSVSC